MKWLVYIVVALWVSYELLKEWKNHYENKIPQSGGS